MIAQWMLAAVAITLALTIAGWSTTRFASGLGVPRRWFWLAVMLISVALPAGMAMRTPRPEPERSEGEGPPVLLRGGARGSLAFGSGRGESRPGSGRGDKLLLLAWAAASLLLAGIFTRSHRRIRAELAACPRQQLDGATVAVSQEFGPAAVGLLRSEVIMPEWVFELPPEEQRLVLRHEQEHIVAGDRFVLLAGVTLAVLMPWNLALWWQLRRLRIAMELDCDARVAPRAADRPRYSQLLLRARTQIHSHQAALAFLPAPSVLAERLHALLDSTRPSLRQMFAWGTAAVAAVSVVTCVPVPSLQPATPAAARYDSLQPVIPVGAPGHPRYDSLVPYVQGMPGAARGVPTGSGVPAKRPDSGSIPQ